MTNKAIADQALLKCLYTSPRFQNMTVAEAIAELRLNSMLPSWEWEFHTSTGSLALGERS